MGDNPNLISTQEATYLASLPDLVPSQTPSLTYPSSEDPAQAVASAISHLPADFTPSPL